MQWQSKLALPARAWSVSLDHLPHLDPAEVRRVRIMFRIAGQVAIDLPRLLR